MAIKKFLSERAAWLAIAAAFDHVSGLADPSLLSQYGLCHAISRLADGARISDAMFLRMRRRIRALSTPHSRAGNCHLWPLDTDGRVSRARAARRFAKQTVRKSTSK